MHVAFSSKGTEILFHSLKLYNNHVKGICSAECSNGPGKNGANFLIAGGNFALLNL